MRPAPGAFYVRYRHDRYVEFIGDIFVFAAVISDRKSLFFSQLGHSMRCASVLATLADLVGHILGLVAEKEMIGVHAPWVVTSMKNVGTGWDFPTVERP